MFHSHLDIHITNKNNNINLYAMVFRDGPKLVIVVGVNGCGVCVGILV